MIQLIFILFFIKGIEATEGTLCYDKQWTIDDKLLEWMHQQIPSKQFYFAEPHCLEESNFYHLRTCEGLSFVDPQPQCYKIQSNLNACPDTFTSFGNKCCLFLPPVSHENSPCPFPYEGEEYCSSAESVWYPAERNFDYGIGEVVHTGGINYGKPVGNLNYLTKFNESNCVTIRGIHYDAVRCDSLQYRVCSYSFLHKTRQSYCPPGCMRTTFESSLKCFCKANMDEDCKLAEFPYEYQSLGVSKLIPGCKIGLNNGTHLSWISNQELTYTDWTYVNYWDVPKSFQSFITTKNGWRGQGDSDEKCKICELNIEYQHPSIEIKESNTRDTLIIKATHINSFIYYNEVFCFCFSDMIQKRTYELLYIKCNETFTYLPISSSGYYWCEGFEIKESKKVVSNKVLVITENIYILQVTFYYVTADDPTCSEVAWRKIRTIQKVLELFDEKTVVKWMKTLNIDENEKLVTYLIHICKPINKDKYLYDYNVIKRILDETIPYVKFINSSSQLKNSEYCFEAISNNNGIILTWNLTPKNTVTTSKEPCFKNNGQIITRYCSYDFYEGTKWEYIENEICSILEGESIITKELQELLSTENTTEILVKLTFLTQNINSFESIDISLVTNILEKVNATQSFVENITEIVSNIMNANNSILEASQIDLNSTDRILENLDVFLEEKKHTITNALVINNNLITFIFDANSDYAGLALTTNDVVELRRNITPEDIAKIPNIEVATYIPDNLLEDISEREDSKIVINIYLSDALFKAAEEFKLAVAAKSFGIILPATNISYKILLFYKSDLKSSCGFWNYGRKNGSNLKGRWTSEGFGDKLGSNLVLCEFSHVTHFGLLITHTVKESLSLEMITYIGCGMSLLGFLAIFVHALIFKNLVYNRGNQILLQYSIVSAVQILVLFLSNTDMKRKERVCILIGAILHYTVLAQFAWMLVFALLQYKRYVQVIHSPILWVTSKFYLVCYFIPALPVVILLAIDMQNYTHDELCYPTKQGFLLSVLIPVGIIITINIFVFVRIFIQLFFSKKRAIAVDNEFYLKTCVIFLMFFMLGITWTFGFIAEVFRSEISVYIFCATASMQGFILFLFFILLNGHYKKMCACTKSNYRNNQRL